jgi:hypothetical protein
VVTCEFCSSVYQFTPHEAGVEEDLPAANARRASRWCL